MFDFVAWTERYAAWLPLFIFCSRICDVSLDTIRLICVVRGLRSLAACIGFVQVTIWVFAISTVVSQLHRPLNMICYAAGFATGNWLGMWLETKIALGQQVVRFISRDRGHSIAYALRMAGFGVTTVPGRGQFGPVTICFVAAARREVPSILEKAYSVDPEVFITVEDVRMTNRRSYPPPSNRPGLRSLLSGKA